MDNVDAVEETNKDLDPIFRPVADKYGRDMFALVMNAGLCSQATQILTGLAAKHRSQHSLQAIGILSRGFNEISQAYCIMKGWDSAILAQCDRDIQLAFSGKIQVPGSTIILDS